MEKRDEREMERRREGEMERRSEGKMEKVENEKDQRILCVDCVDELEEKEMRELKRGRRIRIMESLYNILHFVVSIRGAYVRTYHQHLRGRIVWHRQNIPRHFLEALRSFPLI
jgi:hypothetical protein